MSVVPELQKRLTEARTKIRARFEELKKRVPIFTRMGYYSHTPGAERGKIMTEITSRFQNVLKAIEPLRPLNVAKRMAERAGLKLNIPSPPTITPSPAPAPETGAGVGMKRRITGGL